jgi:hypothetical protein
VVSKTYTATVTDGQLTLWLKDLGGTDAYVCIECLDLTQVVSPRPAPAAVDLLMGDPAAKLTALDEIFSRTETPSKSHLKGVAFMSLLYD